MKEIMSANVIILNKFHMKRMLDIFQAAKQFNGSTYLYCKNRTVDAANLPKLVSFLLTVETGTALKIIAEGENVQRHLDEIQNICTSEFSILQKSKKRFLNNTETFQI
ncbi:HPr family phosphocarrier protein [Neobacillus notoginsengisoli]|uniref:HPr family phosphocarrier protein n=1 Tax=Neobacillus notoginsengisoli TaxID=1578198 RepID=A0A417YL52_9BACI|nr:HPr family phosphocarrier protein [Neobacillus notoginsengisoli]RHW34180.1 HPr family phosphocarrier protein [Neobacillus notoginsengisoli]